MYHCPKCNLPVEPAALACPHCAAPIAAARETETAISATPPQPLPRYPAGDADEWEVQPVRRPPPATKTLQLACSAILVTIGLAGALQTVVTVVRHAPSLFLTMFDLVAMVGSVFFLLVGGLGFLDGMRSCSPRATTNRLIRNESRAAAIGSCLLVLTVLAVIMFLFSICAATLG